LSKIQIGTQGWNYDDWVGPFYPRGARPSEYLDLYTRVFETVEVDSTFYAIPSVNSIRSWRERAPLGFTYSLKLPQQMTHQQRLHDCADLLKQFCECAVVLGDKLGPVLIQLPPDFSPRSWQTFEGFVSLLTSEMRFAVEFRDRAWFENGAIDRLMELLTRHGVALALIDGQWVSRESMLSLVERPTAPFSYVRWMGPRELTEFSRVQINRDRELAAWAEGVTKLSRRVDQIYGYFNNYYQGHSPASANQFKKMIGQRVVDPDVLVKQPSLF